jgi:hypothetical protein
MVAGAPLPHTRPPASRTVACDNRGVVDYTIAAGDVASHARALTAIREDTVTFTGSIRTGQLI